MESNVIMGVDPGLAHTGWGVVEERGSKIIPLAYGCVETDADQDLATRLTIIHDKITAALVRYEPDALSIEEIYFGVNTKSAIATAHARGAVLVAVGKSNIVLGEYTPMQIKKAVVGTGAADKAQVQYMVKAILALDHEPKPDHAADALAAAICHARMRKAAPLQGRMNRHMHLHADERSAWTRLAQESTGGKR